MPRLTDAARAQFADVVGRPEFFDLPEDTQRQVIRQIAPGINQLTPQGQDAAFFSIVNDPTLRAQAFGGIAEPPSKTAQVLRETPAVLGGIGGGLAGAAATAGSPIGATIGATLGAGGAEFATQKALGEQTQPGRVAMRAAESATGEIGGRAALRVGGRLIAPVVGKAPSAQAAKDLALLQQAAPTVEQGALGPSGVRGIAARLGVKEQAIRPAQLTESRGIGILQNIAEGGAFSGSGLERLKTQVEPQILLDTAEAIANSAGKKLDVDQLAATFQAGLKKRIEARDIVISALYKKIDDTTGTVRKVVPTPRIVDTGLVSPNGKPITRVVVENVERNVSPVNTSAVELKKFTTPLAEQAERLQKIGSENVADREVIRASRLEDEVSFSDMIELRSRFLATKRELDATPGASRKAKRRLGKMIVLADQAVSRALKRDAPDLLPILRQANKLVAKREAELNNSFLVGLVRSVDPERLGRGGGKPEALVKQVFRSPTALRNARRALGEQSSEYGSLLRGFVSTLLAPEADGQISGRLLQARIAKNIDVINELPAQLRKSVFAFGRAAARQQSEGVGIGKVGIQLAQFGPILGLGAAILTIDSERLRDPRLVGGAAFIVLAPNIIGRLLANPVTAKLVTKSMRLSPRSRAFAGASTQLLGAIQRAADDLDIELPIFDSNFQRVDQPPPAQPAPTAAGRPVAAGS